MVLPAKQLVIHRLHSHVNKVIALQSEETYKRGICAWRRGSVEPRRGASVQQASAESIRLPPGWESRATLT